MLSGTEASVPPVQDETFRKFRGVNDPSFVPMLEASIAQTSEMPKNPPLASKASDKNRTEREKNLPARVSSDRFLLYLCYYSNN